MYQELGAAPCSQPLTLVGNWGIFAAWMMTIPYKGKEWVPPPALFYAASGLMGFSGKQEQLPLGLGSSQSPLAVARSISCMPVCLPSTSWEASFIGHTNCQLICHWVWMPGLGIALSNGGVPQRYQCGAVWSVGWDLRG